MKKTNTLNVVKLAKKPQPKKQGFLVNTTIKSGAGDSQAATKAGTPIKKYNLQID